MLDKLQLINGAGGKSNVPDNIEQALKITKKKVMVALDYDSSLTEMLSIIRSSNIELSRISFISMEPFLSKS